MKKLKIDSCLNCPHSYTSHQGSRILRCSKKGVPNNFIEGNVIPDWCILDDEK